MRVQIAMETAYDITIGDGIFAADLAALIEGENYFLCIDSRVMHFHKELLLPFIDRANGWLEIVATETHKSQETVDTILAMLHANGAGKDVQLVAIGGGIIGDVVGYAAAIYMRGIPFIQVPTTLLSQVDSSIGGKVAINQFGIKNVIGTFYSPSAVIVDIAFLDTLTERLFKSGFVELLKHGFIKDASILTSVEKIPTITALRNNRALIQDLIHRSLAVKKAVVEADFLDTGLRHILNFGHTFGHALEMSTGTPLYHGECVAIGILVSCMLSEDPTIFTTAKNILEKFCCIRTLKTVDLEKITFDKKRQGKVMQEVVLSAIGAATVVPYDATALGAIFAEKYQKLQEIPLEIQEQAFVFSPVQLKGTVHNPPSKSYAHRYIIAAALSTTPTVLSGMYELSNDIRVTIAAVENIGVLVVWDEQAGTLVITPNAKTLGDNPTVQMGESGTSLRLLLPILVHTLGKVRIIGENKLPTRPMDTYYEALTSIDFIQELAGSNLPLQCNGVIQPGRYLIDGNVSSQFLSGLLIVLPLLQGESEIVLRTPLESIPYVQMTLDVLQDFGINIECSEDYSHITITGGQQYISTGNYQVEQDYSSRGFFEVAASLPQHTIIIDPPRLETLQGDAIVADVITDAIEIVDLMDIPDTAPILSILFAQTGGKLCNTQRLQFKESDRLAAVCDMLTRMGISYQNDTEAHTLTIQPGIINGGQFNTYEDHRMTMSLIVASTIATSPIELKEVKSTEKSYRNFINHYEQLGGFVDEK